MGTSEHDWLRVRSYLQEHRHALAMDAASKFPADSEAACLRRSSSIVMFIEGFAVSEPMQAAGAAVLRLAWQHRKQLLG